MAVMIDCNILWKGFVRPKCLIDLVVFPVTKTGLYWCTQWPKQQTHCNTHSLQKDSAWNISGETQICNLLLPDSLYVSKAPNCFAFDEDKLTSHLHLGMPKPCGNSSKTSCAKLSTNVVSSHDLGKQARRTSAFLRLAFGVWTTKNDRRKAWHFHRDVGNTYWNNCHGFLHRKIFSMEVHNSNWPPTPRSTQWRPSYICQLCRFGLFWSGHHNSWVQMLPTKTPNIGVTILQKPFQPEPGDVRTTQCCYV